METKKNLVTLALTLSLLTTGAHLTNAQDNESGQPGHCISTLAFELQKFGLTIEEIKEVVGIYNQNTGRNPAHLRNVKLKNGWTMDVDIESRFQDQMDTVYLYANNGTITLSINPGESIEVAKYLANSDDLFESVDCEQ